MNVIDQYPSTFDMPTIGGAQDAVEAILVGALKRYKRGGTPQAYIVRRQVCAIGALAREAGITPAQWKGDLNASLEGWGEFRRTLQRAKIEKPLIEATKEAIKILNNAAVELFPESRNHSDWSGPLEWINQRSGARETELWRRTVKRQVVQVYNRAIENRRAALAA